MTFPELWAQLKRKKPALEKDDASVEFTAGNLRKLLRQVYEQGQAYSPEQPKPDPTNLDMFSEIFGGRGR